MCLAEDRNVQKCYGLKHKCDHDIYLLYEE